MLEKFKANILFHQLFKRRDIRKAYAMVKPTDSWFDTITTVHNSVTEIDQFPHENWELTSHDGLSLKAFYYPGSSDKTVIWIHGYTSHAQREAAYPGLFYHRLGFNILIPYLRSHGPSEGKYISFGPMETLDLKRWIEKVNLRNPEGSILLHGLSMGGGIVLDLATMDLPNVKCMIADAPVASMQEVIKNVTCSAFKHNRDKILDYVHERYHQEFSSKVEDFNRIQNIKTGKYPLLLSAGSNEHMEDIFAALKNNNPRDTTILILPGCSHGNGMYKQTELYQTTIRAFVKKHIS